MKAYVKPFGTYVSLVSAEVFAGVSVCYGSCYSRITGEKFNIGPTLAAACD